MTRSLRIGTGLGALLAATSASAQLKVAQPQDIVDAVASCMAATVAGSVDVARLATDGWRPATLTGKGGAVDTPLRFYSRKQSPALIMTMASAGSCIATARMAKVDHFSELERAIATRFGGKVVERKPGETLFIAGGEVVSLTLTGKPEAPTVRIGVMQVPQEKK